MRSNWKYYVLNIALVIIGSLAITLGTGVFKPTNAAPVQQIYPQVSLEVETTLELGWVLYSYQFDETDQRFLQVGRPEQGSPSAICGYNAANTEGLHLTGPGQLDNGDFVYLLYINRTAEQGVRGLLDELQQQLDNPDMDLLLDSIQDFDMGDLEIGDVHGSIVIPNTDNLDIAPSITC